MVAIPSVVRALNRPDASPIQLGSQALRAESMVAAVNLVDPTEPPVLSRPGYGAASELMLCAKVRARGDAEALRVTFEGALDRWMLRHDLRRRRELLHSLSPLGPIPTHISLPAEPVSA